jgi:hypothetical protein
MFSTRKWLRFFNIIHLTDRCHWRGFLHAHAPFFPEAIPVPVMAGLGRLWGCVRAPGAGFRDRAAQHPDLGRAVRDLLLLRTLPALAGLALGYLGLARILASLLQAQGPVWDLVRSRLPDLAQAEDLKAALGGLPPLPGIGRVLPWLAFLAPVAVLSLWLHDAVWDHLALWLLRGLGRGRFRDTLVAEAEALQVGVFGALAGLLRHLGLLVGVLLLPVGLYFWILRGHALAAWHGCPVWKGVLATLLHALLLGLLFLAFLALVVGGLAALAPG